MIEDYLSEKQKKRKQKKRYFTAGVVLLSAYFFLVGTSLIVLRSPLFRARNIVVEGNNVVSKDAVVALLQSAALREHGFWNSMLGISNMLAWPSAMNERDVIFIPELAAISIDKSYFSHTVTAKVTERKPIAIWCFMTGSKQCYWFDDSGVIFERSFDTQGSSLFSIHDYSQKRSGLGGKILAEQFVKNFLSVASVIKQSGVDVEEVALKDIELEEIVVKTYDGPTLYFSLRFPAANDLPVLQSLMADRGFGKLNYIDFRVENRAYYK
jgi:cell division septal protein FtsQ